MRGIVLRESLVDGALPMPLHATVGRRYPYLLDGRTPVEVIELAVTPGRALDVAMQLATALLPARYYAHLVDHNHMFVCFPNCVVNVYRGDTDSVRWAQEIGGRFNIPVRQMRFAEMFDNDHPDAATPERHGAATVNHRTEELWRV